ncbi:MAG TPA: Lrp/AsnC family transcriptional regulator [Ilumatobacteraceae bacterium]|nr:Lrp/AsnC family transcriptional regulator [Ilumatobacteraceae bacterium]
MSAASHGGDLDEIDRHIIDILRADGRATFGEIGTTVGLSAPAAKRRVDRLVDRGVIRGFTVMVDHAALGFPLEAFAELRFDGDTAVEEIDAVADDIPEVVGIFTLAGDPDALAWLRVRDVHDLKRVINLIRNTGKVSGTKTLMVLGGSDPKP